MAAIVGVEGEGLFGFHFDETLEVRDSEDLDAVTAEKPAQEELAPVVQDMKKPARPGSSRPGGGEDEGDPKSSSRMILEFAVISILLSS